MSKLSSQQIELFNQVLQDKIDTVLNDAIVSSLDTAVSFIPFGKFIDKIPGNNRVLGLLSSGLNQQFQPIQYMTAQLFPSIKQLGEGINDSLETESSIDIEQVGKTIFGELYSALLLLSKDERHHTAFHQLALSIPNDVFLRRLCHCTKVGHFGASSQQNLSAIADFAIRVPGFGKYEIGSYVYTWLIGDIEQTETIDIHSTVDDELALEQEYALSVIEDIQQISLDAPIPIATPSCVCELCNHKNHQRAINCRSCGAKTKMHPNYSVAPYVVASSTSATSHNINGLKSKPCVNCGRALRPTAKFCTGCGSRQK